MNCDFITSTLGAGQLHFCEPTHTYTHTHTYTQTCSSPFCLFQARETGEVTHKHALRCIQLHTWSSSYRWELLWIIHTHNSPRGLTHTHLKPDVSDTAGPCLCDMLDSGAGLGGLNEIAHQMPTRQSRAEPSWTEPPNNLSNRLHRNSSFTLLNYSKHMLNIWISFDWWECLAKTFSSAYLNRSHLIKCVVVPKHKTVELSANILLWKLYFGSKHFEIQVNIKVILLH